MILKNSEIELLKIYENFYGDYSLNEDSRFARVNSFATKGKGTWGKADSDLAAKVRKNESLDELYVIGHTKTYDSNFDQYNKNKADDIPTDMNPPPHKMGVNRSEVMKKALSKKDQAPMHKDEAGAAYKTAEDARAAIQKNWPEKKSKATGSIPAQKEMSVYKLKGAFNNKTVYHNPDTGQHHLHTDTEISHKVAEETNKKVDEACWTGYKQVGTKKLGKKIVPNCVKEDIIESSDAIKKIIEREKKHKAIAKTLKAFSDIAGKTDSEDHLDHAAKIIKSNNVAIEPEELVKLYNKIHNADDYEKAYNAIDAWESVRIDKADPKNREYGTDSLVRILKADTPGEKLDEAKTRFIPPIKHSKSMVKDFVEPLTPDLSVVMSKHNKHHLGIGLNLKQMVKHALADRDVDGDGDVDAADRRVVGDGELVADPSFDKTKTPGEATSKMKKKYEKEMQHTKPGVAFESINEKFEMFMKDKGNSGDHK